MRKNTIKMVVLVALIFGGTSCSDFLDMPSKEAYDSETVFETVDKAEMAVLGCYSQTFNREYYYQLGMGTDECLSTESETNSKNQVANYVYSAANAPTGVYNTMYKGIEYANVCIKNLEGMSSSDPATEKKINYLLGEVLSIRAENYLNLIRFFGDVPFITTPTVDAKTFYSSRSSRDTIYDHIIADLQRATSLLSWNSENIVSSKTERFTKNAAYGILARVALYAAGYSLRWDLSTYDASSLRMAQRTDKNRIRQLYQIAANACKAVIDRGENNLLPKYETVFRDLMEKKFDSETMLQIGQYSSQVSDYNIGYTNGIYSHTNTIYRKTAPQMVVNPVYYFDFEDGDERRDVTICNYGYDQTNDKIGIRRLNGIPSRTIGKFRVDWKTNVGVSASSREIDFPLLRYSDVLLMYAEALNELNNGPTSEAVNSFKAVRLRAFGGDQSKIGSVPTDHDGFLKAIQRERKLELGFEGWRRTDLCRWNIQYETLTQNKADILSLAKGEGKFAEFYSKRYAAYKPNTELTFSSNVVAMDYIPITKADSAAYVDKGFTVQNMLYGTSSFTNGSHMLSPNEAWITTSLFRGLTKNQTELLPLSTTGIIDINKGLEGEQHPAYK